MNKLQTQLRIFNNTLIGISRSALNRSTSKNMSTFSKGPRFLKPHLPPYFFHKSKTEPNIEETVKKVRFPTIPKTQRTFYFNKEKQTNHSPSPQNYNIKNLDEIWKIKRNGEVIDKRRSKTTEISLKPGPIAYQRPDLARKSFNKSSTFQKSLRNTSEFFNTKGKDSPGPKYEPLGHFSTKKVKTKVNSQNIEQKTLKVHERRTNTRGIDEKINRFQTQLLQRQLVKSRQRQKSRSPQQKKSKQKKDKSVQISRPNNLSNQSRIPGPGQYVTFSQFSGWS